MSSEIKLQHFKIDKANVHPSELSDNLKLENEKETVEVQRDNWTGKLDFLLSALSYSVGLGAVWRFPYLTYQNGGGAFLIPFFIFMIIIGVPVMYLELAVGQFMSRGPVLSWVMVPLFKGVGISMNMINNYVNIYYIMIIGYSLYYLILSLNSELPWSKCNPKWSSEFCVDDFVNNFTYTKCNSSDSLKCGNGRCYNLTQTNEYQFESTELNITCESIANSSLTSSGYWKVSFPSQDFWNNNVLNKSNNIQEIGSLVWELVLALFVSWVICFFCLFRGVKLSGKITYFTALFPYLVLFILGIRGWILPGAEIGIKYYIYPDLERLQDPKIWAAAAVQVFFTLSLSYGGLIALSSYNKFNNNILRDTIILSISNFLTCILAGFVVFAYIGNLAQQTGLDIENVVQKGQGLVYVVYPFAATTLSVSPLWSVMFFIMMIALGMGTMMASVETLTTSLEDFFPVLKKNHTNKAITLAIICLLYFLVGLLLCSQSGTYWIDFLDEFSANWSIFVIGIVECISVSWFYGLNRFKTDIRAMVVSHHKLHDGLFILWELAWALITPGFLIGLVIFQFYDYQRLDTEREWVDIVGNIVSASSLTGIFGWMFYAIFIKKKNSFAELIEPDQDWHPLYESNKQLVRDSYLTPQKSIFNVKNKRASFSFN